MIRQHTLFAVHESAQQLTGASMTLEPIPTSPLAELSGLCKPAEIVGLGPSKLADATTGYLDICNLSMAKDIAGNVPHDQAMERYVSLASKVIEGNLNLARNIVNPIIKKVVEDATAYADSKTRSRMSPMNVVPYHYPEPYNSPILAELVSRYGDVFNNDMKLTIVFPPMAAGQIREMAKTGISRLDGDISNWLSECSDEFVEGVYNNVFGDRSPTLTSALSDVASRPAVALLVFLLARRFMDDIPDGINSPLNAYKEYMSGLMSQSGRQVVNAIRRREDNDRLNAMVIKAPRRNDSPFETAEGNVVVNADVYRRWLKEGGNPEVIFGAIHLGNDDLNFQALLDGKDKYLVAWQRALALLKTKTDFERFNHFLEGMRQAMLTQIAELDDDIRAVTDQAYKERLTEHLARVKEGGVDEPWAIARKLVCRVLFPHTDAEKILWAIATQCKNNPELDVREAALLATIEIVALWVADQFKVEKVFISK